MPYPCTAKASTSHFSKEGGLIVTDNQQRSDSEPDRVESGGRELGERRQLIKGIEADLDDNGENAAASLLTQMQTAFGMLLQYLDQEDQSEERNYLLYLAQSLLREMQSELLDLVKTE